MVESLSNLLVAMGAEWVLILMLMISVVLLAIILMRFMHIRTQERMGAAFWLHKVEACFQSSDANIDADEAALNYPCLETEVLSLLKKSKIKDTEKGQLLVESFLAQRKIQLEKYLAFLGTIGNNAPFIGLLGTVIGIVKAFYQLGQGDAAAQGIQGMSGGISEALVATAVGLFIAIPAVIANNYLKSKIDTILQRSRSLAQLIISKA